MRHAAAISVSLLLALGAFALAAPIGHTQEGAEGESAQPSGDTSIAERLNGRWALVHGEEAAQRTVDQAIEHTTDGMVPIVSGVTANELRERNPVNGAFTIQISPERIRTEFETATFDSAPGASVRTNIPGESEEMQLVQVLREGRLEQIFTTDRGRRWSVFVPSADGQRLTMQVTITSGIIPRPLRYELEYQRAQ
ncbi:hypothetical protein [Sandaracinus amylolyticus]|uniref:DUF1579 domain-containing protein n=1 Tax=Sandaracinus amylolyticus TaxID=927083 RepID=A0A0F6W8M0_9BACT|nr:hypothetical protein [Sandaracinus amylolyticus]AKF10108.1 hypothetical protein DB32_007257 [Sandaracinus amylolyticus]